MSVYMLGLAVRASQNYQQRMLQTRTQKSLNERLTGGIETIVETSAELQTEWYKAGRGHKHGRAVSILDILMITGLPVAGKGARNSEGEAHGDC